MRRPGLLRQLGLWAMPVALLALVAAVVVLPRVTSGAARPPTPVIGSRPVDVRRERDVRFTNEYLYDSSYETCDALKIDTLARKLGVPAARPSVVARAFAERNYATAMRVGPYQGCLDALASHAQEPRRRR
jgi:hypothetical protein